MLDKNGNKLLKPSPLKGIGSALTAYNGYKMKQEGKAMRATAKAKMDAAQVGLSSARDSYSSINVSNPFADVTNAYEGLKNTMADTENVYEDQENVYEGMQNTFEQQKNAFEGMENAMEDLTVNTQQAEFEAQQNQQMQANIMSQMAGSAGGSGIAALAQSMASQGALQAQKASASIGQQEAANQKAAAEAEQNIAMSTAQEQSRLDTQKNQADMDVQKTIMGAEEAMQAAELGEASRLQMAERQEASNLQMAEAQGAMQIQTQKAEGAQWQAGMEMQQAATMMDQMNMDVDRAQAATDKADAAYWAGQSQMTEGIAGLFNPLSDRRAKEDIVKLRYSDSGIPIYTFKYKNDNRTWIGTMAQDLLELGRKDAVTIGKDGYYRVNYNLIDVDMKEIKLPSPLKQMGGGGGSQPSLEERAMKQETMTNAGMDILSENKKRLNWNNLQLHVAALEPPSMRKRKYKDKLLTENMRKVIEIEGGGMSLPRSFLNTNMIQIKLWQNELYAALLQNDKRTEKEVMMKLAGLDQSNQIILQERQIFYEDHLEPESHLSKGNSKQQISFATQIYCDNPELIVSFATEQDVLTGKTDCYGDAVLDGVQYAIVYDFWDRVVLVPVTQGNRGMFFTDKMKALEYLNFLKQTNQLAVDARKSKSAVQIDLGRINYKIDQLFGYDDGSAVKEQDELVLSFAHDDAILQDGSTFKRHLYEHPDIQNLGYGDFDLDQFDALGIPPGAEDGGKWSDQVSEVDKIRMVDAIVNQDNSFFEMGRLRSLVKEYYTYKLEDAWWKGMGFEMGKLEVMRLKQNLLIEDRFKRDKAQASKEERKEFEFDGKIYPTGLTDASIKKKKAQQEEKMKEMQAQQAQQAQQPQPQPQPQPNAGPGTAGVSNINK